MNIIDSGKNLIVNAYTSEGLPENAEVGEGTVLHFIDTGEEYIFHNNMWELDLRKALAPELIYNGV